MAIQLELGKTYVLLNRQMQAIKKVKITARRHLKDYNIYIYSDNEYMWYASNGAPFSNPSYQLKEIETVTIDL